MRNVVLQDLCPTDISEHNAISYNAVAMREVMNALGSANGHPTNAPSRA